MVTVMVIPDALRAGAEAAVASIYQECVGPIFDVKLSATGSGTATHWAGLPIVDDSVLMAIQYMASTEPFSSLATLRTCEPIDAANTFSVLINELGLKRIEVEE